ncbi:hypothetical protein NDU88_004806 [Pleurodeles waltl]|uniref:Uncharacterized protein n=1 Tax=Pleurodeles waltl TaxID=8319 RepID=A0AAV7UH60_PLEWA|nr:hypothetical protein NDU88_004806 [Pleurodeles waltl]
MASQKYPKKVVRTPRQAPGVEQSKPEQSKLATRKRHRPENPRGQEVKYNDHKTQAINAKSSKKKTAPLTKRMDHRPNPNDERIAATEARLLAHSLVYLDFPPACGAPSLKPSQPPSRPLSAGQARAGSNVPLPGGAFCRQQALAGARAFPYTPPASASTRQPPHLTPMGRRRRGSCDPLRAVCSRDHDKARTAVAVKRAVIKRARPR